MMTGYRIRETAAFLRRKLERMRDLGDLCLMIRCDWDGVECPFADDGDCVRKLGEAGVRILDRAEGIGGEEGDPSAAGSCPRSGYPQGARVTRL